MKALHCLILFSLFSYGCVATLKPLNQLDLCRERFPFIEDQSITKSEIIELMDKEPNSRQVLKSRSGKVLIYTVDDLKDVSQYNLVLVFDENDLLQKHSFLKMR